MGGPVRGGRQDKRIGPKPIRGPKFSGGPLVAGFGLLSILIVVAIMAFMAVKILDGVGSDTPVKDDAPGTAGVITPGLDVPPAVGPDGSGAGKAASAASCGVDKRTVATAAEAYSVINGIDPTDVDQLVAADLLKENPGTFVIEPGAERVRVVGVGLCKGTS
ncbi:MAG: hypothetical protein WBF71_05445 [Microthrixaceae bacterium]